MQKNYINYIPKSQCQDISYFELIKNFINIKIILFSFICYEILNNLYIYTNFTFKFKNKIIDNFFHFITV